MINKSGYMDECIYGWICGYIDGWMEWLVDAWK